MRIRNQADKRCACRDDITHLRLFAENAGKGRIKRRAA
jgi:hypothetical protein